MPVVRILKTATVDTRTLSAGRDYFVSSEVAEQLARGGKIAPIENTDGHPATHRAATRAAGPQPRERHAR